MCIRFEYVVGGCMPHPDQVSQIGRANDFADPNEDGARAH